MNKVLFSLIIPVYNVEEYLYKCIRSILDQDFKNFELILIDDGSPDNCPEMCDEWAKKDVRIKVYHKENGGLSDTRNYGIEKANGKYIVFIDSDDYLVSSNVLKEVADSTVNNPDVIVLDGISNHSNYILKHIEQFRLFSGSEFLKISLLENKMFMAAWLYIYRKDFLDENCLRFKKGFLHEDEDFTPRAMLAAKTVINTGINFYYYNIRENSITTKLNKEKNIDNLIRIFSELGPIYDKLKDKKLKKLLKDSMVRKYLSLFRVSNCGKKYVRRKFVLKNSYCFKTKLKAMFFFISPSLYSKIVNKIKNQGS